MDHVSTACWMLYVAATNAAVVAAEAVVAAVVYPVFSKNLHCLPI